jgi:hypothetical protein
MISFKIGVGFYGELVKLERIVRHRFLGGDEEGNSSMNVEERHDRLRRWGPGNSGNQERNLRRMGPETEELHFSVAARAFDGKLAEDSGQERSPAGREGFFRDSLDVSLGLEAQESAGRGSIETGVATHVHVRMGNMHRERWTLIEFKAFA